MAALIEWLIMMGIILSAKQATPELLDQYKDIVGSDIMF